MEKYKDGIELFYAADRTAWRKWLEKNHAQKKAVWLVYYKPASGKTRVSYNDAVDEAICFGWIDGKPNKLDKFGSVQLFAPRNPASNWSRVNKARVSRLMKEGRMAESGLKAVALAKQHGTWTALDEVEKMVIPPDLLSALREVPAAYDYFMAFPRSSKKNILEWIHNAKQPATRAKRIGETARLAGKNIRANHYRQPKNAEKPATTNKKVK